MVAGYAIGVDVGATKTSAGLIDTKGRVVREARNLTPKERGPFAIVDNMIVLAREVSAGVTPAEIAGVGVGVPAQVDFARQEIEFCTNLPLAGIDVRSLVGTGLRLPVTIDNDGNLAAFGECRYGAGRKVSDVLMVTLGTGVGGGMWLAGEPYRGARGLAAEFGHMVIDRNGPECTCGGRGHIEAYLGRPAIARRARSLAESFRGAALLEAAGGSLDLVDADALVAVARAGDEPSLEILRELGEVLGDALIGLVNAFNPRMVCIGGGIGEAADELVRVAADRVDTHALAGRKDVTVVQATLGNDAGILGAAALAFDQYAAREGFNL